jgi:prepilin-type N-terminal cleavage/methylation domain-containing protein
MTRSTSSRRGLTLIEVLASVAILAIVVLAALGLQASSLQGTRSANQMQALHAEARNELAAWRANLATATYLTPQQGACLTSSQRCTIEIRPCAWLGSDLDCTQAQVAAPVAQALLVTVAEGSQSVSLRTIVAGELQ